MKRLKEPEELLDTDGILEQQTQTFKICKKCSGVNTIRSSDTGYNVFAITIPGMLVQIVSTKAIKCIKMLQTSSQMFIYKIE